MQKQTFTSIAAALSIALWGMLSAGLLYRSLAFSLDNVPMLFGDTIIWPNTMTFGALFGVSLLLLISKNPSLLKLACAIWGGSVFGVSALIATTEVEFLLCALITVVLSVTIIKHLIARLGFSALNTMTFSIYLLYGTYVLVDHHMFLFPVFEEVQQERKAAVEGALASADPLAHPICTEDHIDCFIFDPDNQDRFSQRDQAVLLDVHSHKPYNPVVVELTTLNILNNKTDITYAGIRHADGNSYVVLSDPRHLFIWRVLAAKYLIIWSSVSFLALFLVLIPAGHALDRSRRGQAAG